MNTCRDASMMRSIENLASSAVNGAAVVEADALAQVHPPGDVVEEFPRLGQPTDDLAVSRSGNTRQS
jgi:hypothetical protein